MTLDELLEIVTSSGVGDWFTMGCWGASSGPSYRDKFAFHQIYEGAGPALEHDAHSNVASYKPDLSITMAWGLDYMDDFKAPWANGFPDPRASASFIDLFYNNALVFRARYVVVDGGRTPLPLPRSGADLSVPRRYVQLIRLIDQMEGSVSSFDSDFRRAGLAAIDADWPE